MYLYPRPVHRLWYVSSIQPPSLIASLLQHDSLRVMASFGKRRVTAAHDYQWTRTADALVSV